MNEFTPQFVDSYDIFQKKMLLLFRHVLMHQILDTAPTFEPPPYTFEYMQQYLRTIVILYNRFQEYFIMTAEAYRNKFCPYVDQLEPCYVKYSEIAYMFDENAEYLRAYLAVMRGGIIMFVELTREFLKSIMNYLGIPYDSSNDETVKLIDDFRAGKLPMITVTHAHECSKMVGGGLTDDMQIDIDKMNAQNRNMLFLLNPVAPMTNLSPGLESNKVQALSLDSQRNDEEQTIALKLFDPLNPIAKELLKTIKLDVASNSDKFEDDYYNIDGINEKLISVNVKCVGYLANIDKLNAMMSYDFFTKNDFTFTNNATQFPLGNVENVTQKLAEIKENLVKIKGGNIQTNLNDYNSKYVNTIRHAFEFAHTSIQNNAVILKFKTMLKNVYTYYLFLHACVDEYVKSSNRTQYISIADLAAMNEGKDDVDIQHQQANKLANIIKMFVGDATFIKIDPTKKSFPFLVMLTFTTKSS